MKILSVKFSNLNSLREEVDIDFIDGPLGAAGLFAITGPTGSGKSTILDAISLALYNKTARDQRHEIISRGSRKAESAVEFELKGKVYRSTWSMRLSKPRTEGKSPTGTANMELAIVDQTGKAEDAIIGEKVSVVPGMVEDLTGLDFTRFTQSMLLAQGQFDAFLVAKTSQRSDLLEQITGTQIYSDVSKLVYERYKTLSVALNARKEELQKRGAPDEEQIEKLTTEVTSLTTAVEEQSKPIKLLRVVHQAHNENSNVIAQLSSLGVEEQTFSEAAPHRKDIKIKLDAHQRALPLVADLRDLERIKKEDQKLNTELTQAKEVLQKLKGKKSEQEKNEASAKIYFEKAQEEVQQVRVSVEKIKDLAVVIAKSKEVKESLAARLTEQQKQQKKLAQDKTELQVSQEALSKQKSELDKQLESLKVYAGVENKLPRLRELHQLFLQEQQAEKLLQKSYNEAVEAKKSMDASLLELEENASAKIDEKRYGSSNAEEVVERLTAELEELKEYATWLSDFGGRMKSYLEDQFVFQKRIETYTHQQKKLAETQAHNSFLKNEKQTLDAQVQKLATTEKLAKEAFEAIKLTAELRETHLHRLVDGEPCPLCGALEHPALKAMVEVKPASHEALWQTAKANLEKHQVQVETLHKKVANQELLIAELTDLNSATEIEEQQVRIEARAQKLKSEYKSKKPTKELSLDQPTLDALRVAWQKSTDRKKQLIQERNEMQVLAKAWTNYQQAKKTQKARLEDQNERVEVLSTQLKIAETKRSSSEIVFKKSLSETELALPFPLPDQVVDYLQQHVDKFKKNQSSLDIVSTKQTAISKEINQLNMQVESLVKAIDLTQNDFDKNKFEYAEKVGIHKELLRGFENEEMLLASVTQVLAKAEREQTNATQALAKTIKEIEAIELQQVERKRRLDGLQLEHAKLADSLNSEISKRNFESIAQALASLLSETEQQALQSEIEAAARTQASLETRRKTLLESSKSLAAKLYKQPEAAVVASQLQELEQTLSKTQVALGGADKELKRALEDRKAMARDAAAVAKQEEELYDWITLKDLIGSADGARFRQYAQRITLQQLIAFANEYLREFYPRFSVSAEDASNKDPLEIFICDHYEADHVRKVATVSGGERFLVSMALALGFSRMASRNISIDTLFIDEGFGTLDGETLDKAIQALEKLQNRGKTIGIISHVASLQERFGAQIRLVRQSSGRSKVEIIG